MNVQMNKLINFLRAKSETEPKFALIRLTFETHRKKLMATVYTILLGGELSFEETDEFWRKTTGKDVFFRLDVPESRET